MPPTLRAAIAHLSPIFLSASLTTKKALKAIQSASTRRANLIAFPESFIPAFPIWSSILPPTHNHHFFSAFAHSSIYVDGPEIASIRDAAREWGVAVSIGISEKVRYSSATLFNSNLIIGSNGEILVHHRKLQATFFEKLSWAAGDGYGLRVASLPSNGSGSSSGSGIANGAIRDPQNDVKLGALICGENTNPLARYSLMAQGEQVHISTWPAIWPTRDADAKKAESKGRNYDNVYANRTRAAAHCFEAKCFGMLAAGHLSAENVDAVAAMCEDGARVKGLLEGAPRAASMFLDPTGAPMRGFSVDEGSGEEVEKEMLQHEEGILYADLDVEACVEGKQYHDVVGGYQRFDVFDLRVDRRRREPVTFTDGGV
ncbi:hypothetical protein LTS18_005025 [Coniosporium uncinatum]|uniref:Uncharacterized protein n=1 Tax=Coniosporium uncinatum TaxID=93489 RepID=A0ACC3DXL8_9PEZI|nr:hypothetical protein LTS18_005025 [Coniosporium uncinatum]